MLEQKKGPDWKCDKLLSKPETSDLIEYRFAGLRQPRRSHTMYVGRSGPRGATTSSTTMPTTTTATTTATTRLTTALSSPLTNCPPPSARVRSRPTSSWCQRRVRLPAEINRVEPRLSTASPHRLRRSEIAQSLLVALFPLSLSCPFVQSVVCFATPPFLCSIKNSDVSER